jgi:hypothetical protein
MSDTLEGFIYGLVVGLSIGSALTMLALMILPVTT